MKIVITFFVIFFILFSINSIEKDSIGNKISKKLVEIGINPYLVVIMISFLPIIELRGAIPTGILFLRLDPVFVILCSIIGNMVPIFFILFIFKYLEKFLRNFRILDRFFDWLFTRTIAKSRSIENSQELGLMLFVGIPLPMTGAWTGSLIAYLLKLSYMKSILYIFFGVLLAALIVSVFTIILTALTLFWQIIIILVVISGIILIYFVYMFVKKMLSAQE